MGQNAHAVHFEDENGPSAFIELQPGSPQYRSPEELLVYVKVADDASAAGSYDLVITGASNQQDAVLSNALTVTPK